MSDYPVSTSRRGDLPGVIEVSGEGGEFSARGSFPAMTFEDERTHGRSDSQRIDHLAEWLEVTLGPRLVAYAVGGSPSDVCRFANGEDGPAEGVARRLRDLYTATWFIASTDGPGSAHDWLTLPNPKLENRAPAELLGDGESPAPVWFSVAPAF